MGYPKKKQSFYKETPNFFGPSYFEAALLVSLVLVIYNFDAVVQQ